MYKQSVIIPIFEAGENTNISKYRRIALISILSQLFEKITPIFP